ncbi:MAG: enoyl-CoA hydratase/isomerase family protein [Acidimicrobiales bacterium]|nr:enoyl-CoA hydratase/isomerase family protein [Acidimicrobiales bacterium]MYH74050.1 enoyl-CoA hydratase/isomerase family protein [Acidimicrobiales bacterium]MYK70588.1 enoyl-CoA hydratase/isomerase family protein [Acidimicrobiales bacterium]
MGGMSLLSFELPSLETMELEPDGETLRVWLNRPESRNAHNQLMIREVGDLFLALNGQTQYRVAVLGGRGKSFCAGADRKEGPTAAANDREARYINQLGRRAARAIEDCEAVTIARVHGHAIGGGNCFATSCDFRVTTADALWYVPEVELGVPLPWGATPRLISEMGMSRARQFVMTSERINGHTAVEWGLAHEVCDGEEELDAAVERWVARLLDLPSLSVQMAKHQLRGYAQLTRLGDLSEFDGDASARSITSEDAQARFGTF